MRCTTVRTMIIASLDDGAVGERERRDLGAHLDACGACRAEQARARRLVLALGRLAEEVPVPPSLEDEVLRRVRGLDPDAPTWAERLRAWLPAPVLAAGAAATILLAVVAGNRGPVREAAGPVARPRVGVETAPTRVATATAPPDRALSGAAGREGRTPRGASDGGEVPPAEPPAELAATLPLLLDLPILRNLEKLENYENIEALTLVDDPKTDEPGTSG